MAAEPSPSLPPSNDEILAHANKVFTTRLLPKSPIYNFLLTPLELISATKGTVVARLPLTDVHVNSKGGIHGSTSATIVDLIGGLAIAAYDLRDSTGVSVDIHITYVSSAKVGDIIEIVGSVDKVGGTLAYTSVTIWKVVDGQRGPVVVKGSHTKYVRI
ncbi:Thioesterase/thiol ester dehydrase-isomerase [Pseudovirgaria hyperparasitica]|uniref:Thioesterase/thiol ester dehydrase-isomerase n=1 Tax=Pseudovirgaria hyperparasitica TaxID=470096 RepID=A0A6A6WEF5_9PEZI|nr:Thioesterase/thiol ester dehydrase-isomerase [Pseudovirgaria hyperparasitica]KAF2759967.1 Thioesterase/thiol ester dehydrase-isomerase [Pseudovirgaria hyperparasitica]